MAEPDLLTVYDRLHAHFGPQHWWPAEDPFEVIVGAILTQSAAWTNVEKAIANLKTAGVLSPDGLLSVGIDDLQTMVHPAGYYNAKSKKLKAFVEHLASKFEGRLDLLFGLDKQVLREELLGIYGVGPETADSIILYAAGKPIFVVDAYTRRLFSRLGLVAPIASYEAIQGVFHSQLPEDATLFNEYHALCVTQCKVSCKKKPVCADCCVGQWCKEGGEGQGWPSRREAATGTRDSLV